MKRVYELNTMKGKIKRGDWIIVKYWRGDRFMNIFMKLEHILILSIKEVHYYGFVDFDKNNPKVVKKLWSKYKDKSQPNKLAPHYIKIFTSSDRFIKKVSYTDAVGLRALEEL